MTNPELNLTILKLALNLKGRHRKDMFSWKTGPYKIYWFEPMPDYNSDEWIEYVPEGYYA